MTLSVRIEKQRISKPYLGGWQHKITGVKYVNADSQTGPLPKQGPRKNTCCRAIQCIPTNDGATQSLRHHVTQMWRDDYYVPNETDKYMTVKSYENYADMKLKLDQYACIIQRNYRAYKWRKYIKECAYAYREMLEKCKKYEEEKATANKLRHKQNILRQIYPRSKADFDMLYGLIEKWRFDRLKDIKLQLSKADQRAENYRTVEKTVEMLNQIDKHKQTIKRSYQKQSALRFLTVNCKPIRWSSYKGKLVEMTTIKIQNAQKLKKIYDALNNCDVSSEERMKLLITLKKWVETHYCVEALDLLSLLDQEITLLNRKIEGLSLDYLNERITHSYLNFVRMYRICGCECITTESKDNELREPLETETKFCRNCLKLLPIRRFLAHTRMKKLTICSNCTALSRRNIAHVDYDPYMFILNCVRAEEEHRGSTSALAFIMQEQDIYHLVNHIWQGQSALSKTRDIFMLRMVRYQKDIEWAPWNCILLTKDEADLHYNIIDLATIYSEHLISQIDLRHLIAKNYFKRLMIFEKELQESCRFSEIQSKEIKYKPPVTTENYDPSKKYKLE
ncbi:IQ and ubiquitin-like domain-containing protein [Trachymyrmex septentrionalis]|uniref:IQ and ubiquitin-like domain-containing protein n=1 Tax=Trachymyrmex septentrionalis TaxID=34720 RepID=A0A195FIS6_9HYME|nr:PREDICTED: IQ and ubiquitin-like domain-containing protein isoform X1 [Trachymyrmex septentrionalis]KYN40172.1 IQ and ubiquitin-like domain-containing protein [Trachymyrmex septentrionalis]